jgi:hypothetical protein
MLTKTIECLHKIFIEHVLGHHTCMLRSATVGKLSRSVTGTTETMSHKSMVIKYCDDMLVTCTCGSDSGLGA